MKCWSIACQFEREFNVESDSAISRNARLECPSNCKSKLKGTCGSNSMQVKSVFPYNGEADYLCENGAIKIKAKESSVAAPSNNSIFSNEARGAASFQQNSNPNISTKAQNFMNRMRGASAASSIANSIETATTQNDKKYIQLDETVYSNDKDVWSQFQGRVKPLSYAFRDILTHWNIEAVFSNPPQCTALSDDFLWLLKTARENRFESDYKKINDDVLKSNIDDPSLKFYYLFYSVIYDKNEVGGFYWQSMPEKSDKSLSVWFRDTDATDFSVKYCEEGFAGKAFRKFTKDARPAILHFLGLESDSELFEKVMLLRPRQRDGIIYYIDNEQDEVPIRLGNISDFRKSMLAPSSLRKMSVMCKFLEKFYVSGKKVLRRTIEQNEFRMPDITGKKIREDVLNLFEYDNPLDKRTDYIYFVTLYKEYINLFQPEEIKIGGLSLDRHNFTEKTNIIIRNFCMYSLSGNVNGEQSYRKNEAAAYAFLIKDLYEREVFLNAFGQNMDPKWQARIDLIIESDCDTVDYVNRYLDNIENPTFLRSGIVAPLSFVDYVSSIICDSENSWDDIVKIFNTDIVFQCHFAKSNMNEVWNRVKLQLQTINI